MQRLNEGDRGRLLDLIRTDTPTARGWKQAQILLLSAQGMPAPTIAQVTFSRIDLVRRTIRAFNTDGLRGLLPGRGQGPPPSALCRALAYCEAHLTDPVSVRDIAAAARTSVRTLQEEFRVQLGTTPLAHLRQLRLDRAHRNLLSIARGQATGTVTDVAMHWGFNHLSRFAGAYKSAYGCHPSETLRSGDHGQQRPRGGPLLAMSARARESPPPAPSPPGAAA